jgi:centrosomal protein CEP76
LLELQLEIMPPTRAYTEEEIAFHVERDRAVAVAADREMLLYARRWWSEYHALRPSHAARRVKVFALSQAGRTLPVTHFVHRMQPDRALESPEDALRFVSLMSADKEGARGAEFVAGAGAGGGGGGGAANGETWMSLFAFVSQRHGDAACHALLLCSLLLGFGLDAYCAVGADRRAEGASRVFVVTRAPHPVNGRAFSAVVWDPVAGQKYSLLAACAPTAADPDAPLIRPGSDAATIPFTSIGCVFNDTTYYANVQADDALTACDVDLDDEAKWKALNPAKLLVVPRPSSCPLLHVGADARALEDALERRLMRALGDYRATHASLHTEPHAELAQAFGQALTRQELRRRGLAAADPGMFEQCVRGLVHGCTFKGLPLNVTHLHEGKILASALTSAVGKAVVECAFEGARFAIRARVFPMPEGVVSVWVMLGVTYRTVPM